MSREFRESFVPPTLFRAFTDTSSVDPDSNLCRAPRTCHEGFHDECVALQETWGTRREADSRGERSSNAPVSIRGAIAFTIIVPLVARINSVSRCLSAASNSPRPASVTDWFTYSAASYAKSNFELTVKRN